VLWEKKTMAAKVVIENPTPITFGIANSKLLGQDNLDFEPLLLPLTRAVCTKLNSKLFSQPFKCRFRDRESLFL
jgi:hypothetical protein